MFYIPVHSPEFIITDPFFFNECQIFNFRPFATVESIYLSVHAYARRPSTSQFRYFFAFCLVCQSFVLTLDCFAFFQFDSDHKL